MSQNVIHCRKSSSHDISYDQPLVTADVDWPNNLYKCISRLSLACNNSTRIAHPDKKILEKSTTDGMISIYSG